MRALKWTLVATTLVWTLASAAFYVATVVNSCGDPEQDCGLALALGLMMALMIWAAGLVVLVLLALVARVLIKRL